MLRKSKLFLYIILIFSLQMTLAGNEAELLKNYDEAREAYTKAHRAFAGLDYKNALLYYSAVERFLEGNPRFKPYFDHHYRNFSMIEIVKKHEALGEIKPAVVHKIAVFYIEKTDAPFKGKRIRADFTGELKEAAYLSQEVCKRYIEVLSGKKVTLEFTRIELDAVMTELSSSYSKDESGNTVEIVQGIVESLAPYPSQLLYEAAGNFDTFLFYWNDNKLKTAAKGGAKAQGGIFSLPFLPYQLYGPERGRIIISAALTDRPGTLLHELFHTLEKCYNINPIHGFYDSYRSFFPGWKGEGEYNYYQYHFDRIEKQDNFQAFEIRSRAKSHVTKELLDNNMQLFLKISPEKRRKAQQIFERAAGLHAKDKNEAFELYKKVISLNPYHAQALLRIATGYHYQGDKEKAYKYIVSAYQVNRADSEICYWIGVEHFHKKEYEKAVDYFTESLYYDPHSAKAFQYRGFVNYRLKKYPDALADFKASLQISSQFKEWIRNYLNGRIKAGDAEAGNILKELKL